MTKLEDLVAWAEDFDADGPVRERALESLRPASIAALLAAGERSRGALRVAAPLYLRRAASDLERTYRARRAEALAPWQGDVDAALAAEPDPAERHAIAGRFRDATERLMKLREERDAARDEGARRAGARDARALRLAGREPEAAGAADEVERGFVGPTDDALASAVRERARGAGLGGGPITPEDVPRMSWLPDRRELLGPSGVRGVLRDLAAGLGLDAEPRPASTWGGPRALRDALSAFGPAARARFVGVTRGRAARATCDPAFTFAAEALFSGILASRSGLRASGLPDDEALLSEIRLEKLIEARQAWAVLASEDAPDRRAALLLRAGGRPLAPGEKDGLDHDERDPAARLAGISFAILLEERLRTRFGHAWFTRPEAGAYLRDLWAAEPDATPRVMAGDLALGTMDSAPLLEACQPKGRVS